MDAALRRMCRYDQTFLNLLAGDFALAGLRAADATALAHEAGSTRHPDGRLLVVQVWQCAVCGYTELVDDGA